MTLLKVGLKHPAHGKTGRSCDYRESRVNRYTKPPSRIYLKLQTSFLKLADFGPRPPNFQSSMCFMLIGHPFAV